MDTAAFSRVANRVRKVGSRTFQQQAMKELRDVAKAQLAKTRAAYSDPHGRPWRKSVSGAQGLSKIAHNVSVNGTELDVSVSKPWASVHQRGMVIDAKPKKWLVFLVGDKKIFAKRVTIARRIIVPKSIPQSWLASFRGKLQATLHSTLNG